MLYSVKMRAARAGVHTSGAEKIVPGASVPRVAALLAERALAHPKGLPDFLNVKVEAQPEDVLRLKSLPVTTHVTKTAAEGRALAAKLLGGAGVARIDEIMARFSESHALRGAMLLDADTLERLEPDPARGVRATYMDDAASLEKGTASGKNHYAEAIVLATKVQNAPGIVAEICVSDDPDYVTGYVATRELGYRRITVIKEKGDPNGGRIFLYRGPREGVAETVRFLEKTPVIVTDVPVLACENAVTRRFDGLGAELAAREAAGLSRRCRTLESPTGPVARVNGRELVVLASNDYLDLARDPRVVAAAAEAAREWGAGSGGARLTTGTQPPHVRLERALADFKGCEGAIVYGTGYMANVGAITALVGKGDAVLSDELNHASIIEGCRLSGADVFVYRHGDMDDLDRKLSLCREHRRRLAVSDGVFSMDGDILDLPRFIEVTRRHDAFSMVDEAHATGVVGPTGRGLVERFGCERPDILMGTLSKALGSERGFVCGSRLLVDYLRNLSRPFIFSTAPGAPAMAAALAALEVLVAEPERVARLRENVALFVSELSRRGVSARGGTPIVPIVVGNERKALDASTALEARGFLVPALRYPPVARGAARLRVAIMSAHTPDQLRAAAAAIADSLRA
ncbi:MAG: 6-carboxyhexanoate--CoA ligase [Kiritimatiellae bacterium]|nr:6-carboxyhexanoate--CoA ligase [Kiritimatiellia bacterium]